MQFGLIEEEINDSSGNTRNEFKGTISSQKIEFNKIKQEIKLLENKINLNILGNNKKIEMKNMDNNELKEQMDYNTNTLKETNKTANEIVDRNKMMNDELKRQGNVLLNVHLKMGETEENLTMIQQLRQVMQNRDLFYRLKLYAMAILLFFANILVIYIKFR